MTSRYPFLPRSLALPVARTEGVHLVLPDGRRILDAAGGAVVVNVGHGRQEVADAVHRALGDIGYVVPPLLTDARTELVDRLLDRWLPKGLVHAFFTSGGSEAVDAALRLARQYHVGRGDHGRWKVIGLDPSYHGMTLAAVAAGSHAPRRAGLDPLLLPFPKVPLHRDLTCRAPQHDEGCGEAAAARVEQAIVDADPATVAAVVAEPVTGSSGGAIVPPPGFWPRLREVCDRHGVLLVADEVMTGFGRTGRRFAVEHWDVLPDVLVAGKGLAGGYAPIGGVYATAAVVEALAGSGQDFMFFTNSAHHASCAAACAVLDILEREDLVARAEKMGALLHDRLTSLAAHPHVAEVRGKGLLAGVELVADKASSTPFPASAHLTMRVVEEGLERGVFFYPGGAGDPQDVVVLGPPFVIEEGDVDRMVEVLQASLDAATASLASAGRRR